jgi:hypothetical protein
MRILCVTIFFTGLFGALCCSRMDAQDLEPRAYAPLPTGANFAVAGLVRSSGDVLFDATLPVSDVHATVHSPFIGGSTSFNFFGRTALGLGVFPYAVANITGNLNEQATSISRSGLADFRFKLSVNFVGGRAMKLSQFARTKHPTVVGASVTVVSPTGQYDSHKVVNIGSNRWSFKPEVGVSHQTGKWTIEEYAGVWLFTANHNFFTGSSIRTQQPVFAFQLHASYTFRPRLWAAVDWTWYSGGTTSVDGIDKGGFHRNSRIGGTMSAPLFSQQSLKFAFSKGITTRVGANFTTFSAGWQLSWFSRQNVTHNP